MPFTTGKQYRREALLKDRQRHGPTEIGCVHWHDKTDDHVYSILTLSTGACSIHTKITSDEARDLALKLQAFADEVDAHEAQIAEEVAEAAEA